MDILSRYSLEGRVAVVGAGRGMESVLRRILQKLVLK